MFDMIINLYPEKLNKQFKFYFLGDSKIDQPLLKTFMISNKALFDKNNYSYHISCAKNVVVKKVLENFEKVDTLEIPQSNL